MKNQSSIKLEDYEESISLTLRTWSSRKLRMQERNWKHQWLQPYLARHARKISMRRPVARLMISSLNLRVSWKPVNPQECVWENLYRSIMEIILQEEGIIQYSITIWYTNFPMPQAMKIPAAKAALDREWEKLEKIQAWDIT